MRETCVRFLLVEKIDQREESHSNEKLLCEIFTKHYIIFTVKPRYSVVLSYRKDVAQ